MVVYAFYIFDRHSECIYRKRWNHSTTTTNTRSGGGAGSVGDTTANANTNPSVIAPTSTSTEILNSHTEKLIFGTVLSLRNMALKLGGENNNFLSYRTGEYKLHYYETPTRIKFVMLTDIKAGLSDKQPANLRVVLHQIWVTLYVEYVVKNPLAPVEHHGGIGISNERFDVGLESFLKMLEI